MKKSKAKMIIILIAVLVMVSGCQAPVVEEMEEKAIPVKTQAVTTGEIYKDFSYISKLQPEKETMIISSISGVVDEVYFDLGDTVKEGDVLFTVNGTQTQQQLVGLEQQLSMARLSMNDAKEAYDNMKALYDIGGVSEQQYLQAKSGYDQSVIAYNSASLNYDLMLKEMENQNADLSGGTLSTISIKSPMDGIITSRNIDAGDMLSPSIMPFNIMQMDNLNIEIGITEQLVTKLKAGELVDVKVESISDELITGEITAISPAANPQTGAFMTKITISNAAHTYNPGMVANLTFHVDGKQNAVIVPIDAILSDGERSYAYIVVDSRAIEVEVTTGIDNGSTIEITSGLSKDDQLIVKGQNYVYDGSLVVLAE